MSSSEVHGTAPTVVVDGPGRRIWSEVHRAIPGRHRAVCMSSNPWLLAADVRHAVDAGARHFVCVGGDEAWLAVASGTTGVEGVVVSHGGGAAALPRNYGLPADPDRATARLRRDERELTPLDTIRVEPDDGPATEVVNGVWAGFGRRAGLWARALGSWKAGLAVGGTSLYEEYLVFRMGSLERELRSSGFYLANGQFLGKLSIVPRAHPGDGKLELIVFEGPARDIWRVLSRVATGTHLPHPRIREFRPTAVRVEGRGRLLSDGNDIGRLPATFEVRPGRLLVAV